MDYLPHQAYNRDHDRQMDMEADVDYLEEARKQRARRRENRVRTQAFIEELRVEWRRDAELQDAQFAYNQLLAVWRVDMDARAEIEPKLWRAQDRLDAAVRKYQSQQGRNGGE